MLNKEMEFTVGKLAKLVDGEVVGEEDKVIRGVAGVRESKEDTITFAENEKYLEAAFNSAAGAILVPGEFKPKTNKTLIKVKNPRLAFARIASLFVPNYYFQPGISKKAVVAENVELGKDVSIHPGAVISEGVEIGDKTIIAPGVFIGPNVKIGDNTILHPNVVVEYDCEIGSKVTIHAGTVVGSDGYGFVTDEKGHHKIPQLGKVIIEDEVEIGANVTIDRGTSGPTVIGRGSKLDNLIQVGHNVKIGPENLIVGQAGIAGSSILGKRVTLAGKVGVAGHLKIGENTTIAVGSIVTKDIPAGVFYSGNPAHDHRQELREQAARRKLPELIKRIRKLEKKIKRLEEGNNYE